MDDVGALHQAVVATSSAVQAAGGASELAVTLVWWSVAAVLCGTGGLMLWRWRSQTRVWRLGVFLLAVGLLAMGLHTEEHPPHAGPRLIEAQATTCTAMLDRIRNGQIGWMRPEWKADVQESCGLGRFTAAVNAPTSFYDTHPR